MGSLLWPVLYRARPDPTRDDTARCLHGRRTSSAGEQAGGEVASFGQPLSPQESTRVPRVLSLRRRTWPRSWA